MDNLLSIIFNQMLNVAQVERHHLLVNRLYFEVPSQKLLPLLLSKLFNHHFLVLLGCFQDLLIA